MFTFIEQFTANCFPHSITKILLLLRVSYLTGLVCRPVMT